MNLLTASTFKIQNDQLCSIHITFILDEISFNKAATAVWKEWDLNFTKPKLNQSMPMY